MKIIGAILIGLGIAALAYKGFNYKSEETVLQIGSVKATAETEKSVAIPAWAAGSQFFRAQAKKSGPAH
jgi:NO-binding membrane sensor protein with MHYT domain